MKRFKSRCSFAEIGIITLGIIILIVLGKFIEVGLIIVAGAIILAFIDLIFLLLRYWKKKENRVGK